MCRLAEAHVAATSIAGFWILFDAVALPLHCPSTVTNLQWSTYTHANVPAGMS
jgi:hypothetical protein